jgi:hypothetical protein
MRCRWGQAKILSVGVGTALMIPPFARDICNHPARLLDLPEALAALPYVPAWDSVQASLTPPSLCTFLVWISVPQAILRRNTNFQGSKTTQRRTDRPEAVQRARPALMYEPSDVNIVSHQGKAKMHVSFHIRPREVRTGTNAIPYTKEALERDLERVRDGWDDSQADRRRDAIYGYLKAVYDLVNWWSAERAEVDRARQALRSRGLLPWPREDVYAAIIRCTADPARVDKRTRSKWSRVLRYAKMQKDDKEPFAEFVKRKGGINECNARYGRCLRRLAARRRSIGDFRRRLAIGRAVRVRTIG